MPILSLRKIDLSDSTGDYNATHLPAREGVQCRLGRLVGSVTGTHIDKVKSYVAQAKSG